MRVLLVGVCLALVSCAGSSSDPGASRAADDTTSVPEPAVADTTPPPPPPGTAVVQGEIVACNEKEETYRCRIRITVVKAYGMNTPPVAPGTRTVRLRSVILRNRSIDELVSAGPWRMELVHAGPRPQMDPQPSRPAPDWTLASVAPSH